MIAPHGPWLPAVAGCCCSRRQRARSRAVALARDPGSRRRERCTAAGTFRYAISRTPSASTRTATRPCRGASSPRGTTTIVAYALPRLPRAGRRRGLRARPLALAASTRTAARRSQCSSSRAAAQHRLGELQVDYDLLFEIDGAHRGIVNVVSAAGAATGVVSAGSRSLRAPARRTRPSWSTLQTFRRRGRAAHLGGLRPPRVRELCCCCRSCSGAASTATRACARAVAWEIVRVVTAFTAAHSLTLALAASGYVPIPTRFVEVAIAASVLLAAVLNVVPNAPRLGAKLAFALRPRARLRLCQRARRARRRRHGAAREPRGLQCRRRARPARRRGGAVAAAVSRSAARPRSRVAVNAVGVDGVRRARRRLACGTFALIVSPTRIQENQSIMKSESRTSFPSSRCSARAAAFAQAPARRDAAGRQHRRRSRCRPPVT